MVLRSNSESFIRPGGLLDWDIFVTSRPPKPPGVTFPAAPLLRPRRRDRGQQQPGSLLLISLPLPPLPLPPSSRALAMGWFCDSSWTRRPAGGKTMLACRCRRVVRRPAVGGSRRLAPVGHRPRPGGADTHAQGLQAGKGLRQRTVVVARRRVRLQSFALLRHRISQGQWRTLVKGASEAMSNSVNGSPGSFAPKGSGSGTEGQNHRIEWLSTSRWWNGGQHQKSPG